MYEQETSVYMCCTVKKNKKHKVAEIFYTFLYFC